MNYNTHKNNLEDALWFIFTYTVVYRHIYIQNVSPPPKTQLI